LVARSIRLQTQTLGALVGYNKGMDATVDKPASVLVVSGPARERLAGLFRRLYAGRDDVCVVLDRRRAERRRVAERPPVQRRRGERRVSAPWLVFPPG
jgi:hypothetical protein